MASWRNSEDTYGLMAVICHWLTAVTVIGLFALGLWMTSLSYYDPWYKQGPDLHRSIGILLTILVIWRLLWRVFNIHPSSIPGHKPWEKVVAKLTHLCFYLLLFTMFVSGYLITTAEGQALKVFNWFSIPASLTSKDAGIDNLEDLAGIIHKVIAFVLIGLAIVHSFGALKHHFIDKDRTLVRMLGRRKS